MNILIDILPTTVEIDGEEWDINFDFRTSILFEMLIDDAEVSDEEKFYQSLELYYPKLPTNIEKAVEKMIWFYKCGREIKDIKGVGGGKSTQIYSYEYDSEYIYSAFLNQYGIDLQDVVDLHWWKFKAMFKSLKEDNEINKIMGYRAIDTSKIEDKEKRDFYNKMQKVYEIPKSKDEIKKINAIEEALINGGDISKIL